MVDFRYLLAATFALLIHAETKGADKAAPPPPSAFVEKSSFSNPILSPDGTRIVARVVDKLCILTVAALEKGCTRRMQIGEDSDISVHWVGNKELLLHRSGTFAFTNTGFQWSLGGFWLISADTGTERTLLPKGERFDPAEVLWTSPDGTNMLVSGTKGSSGPKVMRLDLATNQLTEVEPSHAGVSRWFADANGTVRAGVSHDHNTMRLFYRNGPGQPLLPAKVAPKPDTAKETMIEDIVFDLASGKTLIVTNETTGRFGVYDYDLGGSHVGKAVFEHPKVDVDGLVYQGETAAVAGVAYEEDRPHIKWLSPEDDRLQATIDKALPNTVNIIKSRSNDGNLVVIATSGPTSPGMYYLFDRKARRIDGLTEAFEGRAKLPLSPVQMITYPARDGLEIPAYLTLPKGREAKGLPLVLFVHGGPFARDHWGYDPFVQFMASRGYVVLQPQFRGSTGFGRDFAEKGYGQWGRAMQDDLLDGIDALAKRGIVDPARVCIVGASYGGYAAMWAAARDRGRYRCAVSLAGVSDVGAMLKYDTGMFSSPRYWRRWKERVAGLSAADLDAVSPLKRESWIDTPILIAHGEDDTNVPPWQSHRLVAVLEHRKANVQSVFYKGEQHGLSDPTHLSDFLGKLETFLAKYNPAD